MRGRVSTLEPPGAGSVATSTAAAAVAQARSAERAATPEPRYALCTIGTNPN